MCRRADLDHLAYRRGLVGKRVGDVATIVTPNGKRELEILKLTTIHDEARKAKARTAPPPAQNSSREDANDLDQRFRSRLRMAS